MKKEWERNWEKEKEMDLSIRALIEFNLNIDIIEEIVGNVFGPNLLARGLLAGTFAIRNGFQHKYVTHERLEDLGFRAVVIKDQAGGNTKGEETVRSVLESTGFNLSYIDIFSDVPSIALISLSIVCISIGILMINFIVFRLILLYYFDKIEYIFKNNPKILKIFKRIQEYNKKLSFIYYVVALLLAYTNFIMAIYFLYKWLEMLNMYMQQ
uniref:hypothetical protein n=1 Tax=Conidiobolus polyspermus TaxID=2074866 RepID=UPI001D101607|nr:hypothetical protein LKZ09_mgp13 [Conidiobolus polyspermus]QZZ81360.1 hypothetical protein [Conidiobolus polyspermus]